jgi:hypothetical protein
MCLEELARRDRADGVSLQEQCKTMLLARIDMFRNAEALVSLSTFFLLSASTMLMGISFALKEKIIILLRHTTLD